MANHQQFANVLHAPDGTVSAPGYAFTGDPNCGFYLVTTDTLGVAASGTNTVTFEAAKTTPVVPLLAYNLVEANTAVSGSENVLTAAESGTVLTNEGTAAENYHTLPTAAAGRTYTFYCQDTNGIRVTAGADDTIRLAGVESAAAGYVKSVVEGSAVTLVAINAVEWVATSVVGTWSVDS